MPSDSVLSYWDANCFTSYINEHPQRLPTLEALLEEAFRSKGRRLIVTSTLSIVEVAFSLEEQQRRRLLPAEEQKIEQLWADTSVVRLIEPHELIMRAARAIIRDLMTHRLAPKAADAIHLATAKQIGAVEFNTYDKKLLNPEYGRVAGLFIREPFAVQPTLGLQSPPSQ